MSKASYHEEPVAIRIYLYKGWPLDVFKLIGQQFTLTFHIVALALDGHFVPDEVVVDSLLLLGLC